MADTDAAPETVAEHNDAILSPEEERKRAREIEAMLAKQKQEYIAFQKQPRLLLLGSSDSGKTTFLKQLRILHGGGFSDEEKQKYCENIATNVLDSIQLLINAAESAQEVLAPEIQESSKAIIDAIVTRTSVTTTSEAMNVLRLLSPHIKAVWKDEKIQAIYKRTGELKVPIQDTAYYFLNKVDELCGPSYAPSNEDILHMRVTTTQITETVFVINQLKFHFYDVGGQQKYRKQWAPYFDNVHAILFLVSLASYDQVLVEDPTINRMHDALQLFGEICNHPLLKHIPITLFLNKKDLFEQKMEYSELQKHFPDYHSSRKGKAGAPKAQRYFEKKFDALNEDPDKKIFVHATCCTDTGAMKVIIMTVVESIMSLRFKDIKLLE